MKIDAHQHFWKYSPLRDTWIDDSMQVLKNDFMPADLLPVLHKNNIDGSIAVQADQSEDESHFLLGLAQKNDFIKGVVGWVDLCADNVEERLAYFSEFDKFKGVRHIVQAERNDFLLRKDFQNGIAHLNKYDLVYDILIKKEQLSNTIKFVKNFSNQIFVLNHMAKPAIKTVEISTWKKEMEVLAGFENVFCKVSGLTTEADMNHWKYQDFVPYLDVVFTAFGTKRLLFGSDWPVCLLAGGYEKSLSILQRYLANFSSDEKNNIMGNNANNIYNLT